MDGFSLLWGGTRGVGWAPHGAAFLSRVDETVFGDLRGWPRRIATMRLRARLAFHLMKFIALQLRACEDIIPTNPDIDPSEPFPSLHGDVTHQEARNWDLPMDSDEESE